MSCRVLGRQVEEAALSLLVSEAIRAGARKLIGRYRRTEKNAMVESHYPKLGFLKAEHQDESDVLWEMNVTNFVPKRTFIAITESST